MGIEMKDKYNEVKGYLRQWWQAILIGFVLGIVITQAYAYNTLIQDCKVMGMFRIGSKAFGCQMSKYE
jgi:hypothetical protein